MMISLIEGMQINSRDLICFLKGIHGIELKYSTFWKKIIYIYQLKYANFLLDEIKKKHLK